MEQGTKTGLIITGVVVGIAGLTVLTIALLKGKPVRTTVHLGENGIGNTQTNPQDSAPSENAPPPPPTNTQPPPPPVYTPIKHYSIPVWHGGIAVYSDGGGKWYPSANKIGGSTAPGGKVGMYTGMSNDGKFARVFTGNAVKFVEKSGNSKFYQLY